VWTFASLDCSALYILAIGARLTFDFSGVVAVDGGGLWERYDVVLLAGEVDGVVHGVAKDPAFVVGVVEHQIRRKRCVGITRQGASWKPLMGRARNARLDGARRRHLTVGADEGRNHAAVTARQAGHRCIGVGIHVFEEELALPEAFVYALAWRRLIRGKIDARWQKVGRAHASRTHLR